MRRNKVASTAIISCVLMLAGCSTSTREIGKYEDLALKTVNLSNIRYEGYTEEYDKIIREYCNAVTADKLINEFRVYSKAEDNPFIDITEYVEYERNNSNTSNTVGAPGDVPVENVEVYLDSEIEEKNGTYGFYYKNANVIDNMVYLEIGDNIYDIPVNSPRGTKELIGDINYNFELIDYKYFDNNKLVVTMQSENEEHILNVKVGVNNENKIIIDDTSYFTYYIH